MDARAPACDDRPMPARWLAALVVLTLPAPAAAQTPPGPTPEALFEDVLVKDPRTTAAVRDALRSDAAFVARPAFADLTGDGRADAVIRVRVPGAAGTIALYVVSTHGTARGRLRVLFRSQRLYRAAARVPGTTLVVTVPRYARGDDLCCPTARVEREYRWEARTRTLRRRVERTIDLRD